MVLIFGYSFFFAQQDRQYFAIQKLKPPVKINMRSCDQLRQALEASPGITMAIAYGFVPSYHTTEHIMNKWYKEQRLAQVSEGAWKIQ